MEGLITAPHEGRGACGRVAAGERDDSIGRFHKPTCRRITRVRHRSAWMIMRRGAQRRCGGMAGRMWKITWRGDRVCGSGRVAHEAEASQEGKQAEGAVATTRLAGRARRLTSVSASHKSVMLFRCRDTAVALRRRPYQRALDFVAFATVDEYLDEGEGEVHGGAGSARRRYVAVPHHGVFAIIHACALGGTERAGETGGAPALQQAGVRPHFGCGADRGEGFVILVHAQQQRMKA